MKPQNCKAVGCGKPSGPYPFCRYHYWMLSPELRHSIRHHIPAAIEYIDKLEHGPPQVLFSCTLGEPG